MLRAVHADHATRTGHKIIETKAVHHLVFHRNPNLSDDWDLERLFFLFPDDDLERLLFLPLSGEEEADRDLFLEDEDPLGDLELDLFGDGGICQNLTLEKSLHGPKSITDCNTASFIKRP